MSQCAELVQPINDRPGLLSLPQLQQRQPPPQQQQRRQQPINTNRNLVFSAAVAATAAKKLAPCGSGDSSSGKQSGNGSQKLQNAAGSGGGNPNTTGNLAASNRALIQQQQSIHQQQALANAAQMRNGQQHSAATTAVQAAAQMAAMQNAAQQLRLGNNRLGCSCGTVPRKGFRCDDPPTTLDAKQLLAMQQQQQRLMQSAVSKTNGFGQNYGVASTNSQQPQEGPLLRLWAEVFQVSAAPNGGVRWQQISDDLVPINVNCVKDTPNSCTFWITAYNTMVDKVLDVYFQQPGTRLGQASECFVYWKDTSTNDTWGLNFTSALNARTFRQLCSPGYRLTTSGGGGGVAATATSGRRSQAGKASETVGGKGGKGPVKGKKKPQSTPSSPSARRAAMAAATAATATTGTELPCTCVPVEQQPILKPKNGKIRYVAAASSTLPKSMFRQDGRLVAYPSTSNLLPASQAKSLSTQQQQAMMKQQQILQQQQQQTPATGRFRPASSAAGTGAQHSRAQYAMRPVQSRSIESSQPSNVRQQLALAQQHQMCRMAACQAKEQELGFDSRYGYDPSLAARTRSKSSDDVRRSVATNTEEQTNGASATGAPGQISAGGHVSRRMTMQQPVSSAKDAQYSTGYPYQDSYQSRKTQSQICTIPNCIGQQMTGSGSAPGPTTSTAVAGTEAMPLMNGTGPVSGQGGSGVSRSTRPTSVPNWNLTSEDSVEMDMRSRLYRSETGRRRSLERSACVDYTDQSPPSDKYILDSLRKAFVQQQQQQAQTQQQFQQQQIQEKQQQLYQHHQQQLQQQQFQSQSAQQSFSPASGQQQLMPPSMQSHQMMTQSSNQSAGVYQQSQTGTSQQQMLNAVLKKSSSLTSQAAADEAGAAAAVAAAAAAAAAAVASKQQQPGTPLSARKAMQANLNQLISNRLLSAAGGSIGSTDQQQSTQQPRSSSPTVRLLQEYEGHLRNLLARGNSTELENFSLNTFEALLSQSMENVVSLMREVQSELDAIRREEQQYRSDSEQVVAGGGRTSTGQPSSRPQSSAQLRPPPAHPRAYWSRSNTLPSRHSMTAPSRSQPSLSGIGLTSGGGPPTATTSGYGSYINGYGGERGASLCYGLNLSGLQIPGAEFARSIRKRGSAPYLDALSMENLPFFSGFSGWNAQASFESNDSRAFLTSSELSDEDKLSLTTALSDEEGELLGTGRAFAESPSRGIRSGALGPAGSAALNCSGAVRKAGFLCVKKWLLRRPGQSMLTSTTGSSLPIELARKRGWKSYWVCLKGTTLLFYQSEDGVTSHPGMENLLDDSFGTGVPLQQRPKHLLVIDGALVQPIPEHPKRDFVFCLSTVLGDAYLFQAPCQLELDHWTAEIHCACAAAFARHRGRSGSVHLLEEHLTRLQRRLEQEAKLKHVSELQLSVHTDLEQRRLTQAQIRSHEESLELCFLEQFRVRCYVASILDREQPNPKILLAHCSKGTKSLLNKLGVFNVSSLHAFVCARSPAVLNQLLASKCTSKRRSIASDQFGSRRSSLGGSRPGSSAGLAPSSQQQPSQPTAEWFVSVLIPPEEQAQRVRVTIGETVEDLVWRCLVNKPLQPADFYLRCKRLTGEQHVPNRSELLQQLLEFDLFELCQKSFYQVELCRSSLDQLFGFSVEAELVRPSVPPALNAQDNLIGSVNNSTSLPDELCVFVSRVEENSLAAQQQLGKGDEIMVINDAVVAELDMMYVESVLQEELSLCMMLRTCRQVVGGTTGTLYTPLDLAGDEYIESLVCPPPPPDTHISDEMIGRLIAPPPAQTGVSVSRLTSLDVPGSVDSPSGAQLLPQCSVDTQMTSTSDLLDLPNVVTGSNVGNMRLGITPSPTPPPPPLQHNIAYDVTTGANIDLFPPPPTSTVTAIGCETSQLASARADSVDDESSMQDCGTLSDTEKLKKVIFELVETEQQYVENLDELLRLYLQPIQDQQLLSNEQLLKLFGRLKELIDWQRTFLQRLRLTAGYDFVNFTCQQDFASVLLGLANLFLDSADQFKQYSSFCAAHGKALKSLYGGCSPRLLQLLVRTCNGDQASSFESHLIRPIQRVLKYPLLLQQLKSAAQSSSVERQRLKDALLTMETVATHINEMQRVHDEYGAIFEHLQRKDMKGGRPLVDLATSELLHYGPVRWVNAHDTLGKLKKGVDLHVLCFVFRTGVVFLCTERVRQKKRLVSNAGKQSETEIFRHQMLIPVSEVQVRATSNKSSISPGAQDTDKEFNWELIHLKSSQEAKIQKRTEKVYQLCNSSNAERNSFLRHIRQIIREDVRNLTLPIGRGRGSAIQAGALQALAVAMPAQPAAQLSSPSCSTSQEAKIQKITDSTSRDRQASSAPSSKPGSQTTGSRKNSTDSVSGGSISKPPKPAPPPRAPNTNRSSGHRLHSGRTIEKQQTIDEKSSPPMWVKDIKDTKGT